MKTIIAIDPGVSGGIAFLRKGAVGTVRMPETGGEIISLLRNLSDAEPALVVMEAVSGFVGGVGQPGSRMFTFGEGYGFIQGAAQALNLRVEMVRPQTWQTDLALGKAKNCATKTIWKNKLKAEAQRRYPNITVTLKTSDALLILDWFRSHGGKEA